MPASSSGAIGAQPTATAAGEAPALALSRFLVGLDASDHANRALGEALRLLAAGEGHVTGIHAYAARLHGARFRQMEGGLPERYLDDGEMQRQREVHDTLISRGLAIVSDSYHDAAEATCRKAGVPFHRLSPEGKNYRRIVEAAESGNFDVVALGALGLGAVPGSLIGTVCERVVRRSPIDVLVIKDPGVAIGEGPIVVGIDGSAKAYGALRTSLEISRRTGAEVHAVAAYDPFYHYVAFNKIAGVLDEEAGKTFRFREQERLHEELIDDGIAKIYRSHLEVAEKVARESGAAVTCKLLQGKAFEAVGAYLGEVGASLLLVGKTGVHADAGLDIGGNAENLLRAARCHVWLGQATYLPPLAVVAKETVAWSRDAEELLSRAPDFVQPMARKAVIAYAVEQGHTFITRDIVEQVAKRMMPGALGAAEPAAPAMRWSEAASALVERHVNPAVASTVRLRAEKLARRDGAAVVLEAHVRPVITSGTSERSGGPASSACPFAAKSCPEPAAAEPAPAFLWTAAAEARLARIPDGFIRRMTRARVEAFAARKGSATITAELLAEKYATWAEGSAKQRRQMTWDDDAAARLERMPDFVRGMVETEIERCAREMGLERVTAAALERASKVWEEAGEFHSGPHSSRYAPEK